MTPYRGEASGDRALLPRPIQTGFAYMNGRIDPPSSLRKLTTQAVETQARSGEVWAIGIPPVACDFLTPATLYIGKLADARAKALALPCLELRLRVQLTENQAAFTAMGFAETGRTAHPGFTRPTAITDRRLG